MSFITSLFKQRFFGNKANYLSKFLGLNKTQSNDYISNLVDFMKDYQGFIAEPNPNFSGSATQFIETIKYLFSIDPASWIYFSNYFKAETEEDKDNYRNTIIDKFKNSFSNTITTQSLDALYQNISALLNQESLTSQEKSNVVLVKDWMNYDSSQNE